MYYIIHIIMKSKQFLYFENNTWHPSSFWDQTHQLQWVFDYHLFKQIYFYKKSIPDTHYAIHKDVYQAFREKLQREKTVKCKRTTRKKKQHSPK